MTLALIVAAALSLKLKANHRESQMFFEFFDWKIKLGIALTVVLAIGSVVCFIYAWTTPTPTNISLAVNKYLHYRWFAVFIASTISIGAATMNYHKKHLSRF